MAYDRLLESRKLIAEGPPNTPYRLSRRRRFIPLAVDVDGDVAATLFVRRGVSGNPHLEAWALERREDDWLVLGGGGGDGFDELFEPRDAMEGHVRRLGGGWTLRRSDRLLPWPRRGISHVEMRLGSQVASLEVGERRVEIAPHGVAIIVWRSRNPPTIRVLGPTGELLESVRPPRPHL